MGYTTWFEGKFTFDKPLTVPQYRELESISDDDILHDDGSRPKSYCDWTPTEDGQGLQWNEAEKFYDYIEWLQWIVTNRLTPWGITMNGQVAWEGEDHTDQGIIYVKNNKIKAVPSQVITPGPDWDEED